MKLIDYGLPYIGEKEITGKNSNPIIINWIKKVIKNFKGDDEEVSWCSIFLINVLNEYDVKNANATARSWLQVGTNIDEKPIPMDCICILWRESKTSWKGHVGIFIREVNDYIYLLGGNQNNEVSIQKFHKSQLLGYRKLSLIKK